MNGDQTIAFAAPAPTYRTITGVISGIDNLPGLNLDSPPPMAFISTDNPKIEYQVYCNMTSTGFSQPFPDGTYTAGFQFTNYPSSSGTENMGFHNIGTITVSGADASVNLAIPAVAKLSGTTAFAGGAPAGTVTINARDTSAPSIKYSIAPYGSTVKYNFNVTSTWTQASPSAYDLTLIKGRSYNLDLSYSVTVGTTTTAAATVTYTVAANPVSLAQDSAYNFSVPALPAMVTLSGKVSDTTGKGLQYTGVTASSSSLTGVQNMTYSSNTALAAADGSYSLTVPSGTNYTLTFTYIYPITQ
jgi:hypothetical protein